MHFLKAIEKKGNLILARELRHLNQMTNQPKNIAPINVDKKTKDKVETEEAGDHGPRM
jgi:hypothetical protein